MEDVRDAAAARGDLRAVVIQPEKPPLPNKVDAGDYWRWQAQANAVMRLRAEVRAAQAELRQVEPEHEKATRELFAKYGIDPQRDSIDAETLRITRTPRPGG